MRELQLGTSDMVLAGGVDAIQNPFAYLCFAKTRALSPRGRCRPFDVSADGIGISEGFTGLVIVALAGNAVENVVGVQFAARNQPDLAVSVILNSSLQIALGLFPALVLLSFILGGALLTFVLSPLLIVVLVLAVIVSAFIIYDGESIWLEGLALIGLYCIIAAAFWWG